MSWGWARLGVAVALAGAAVVSVGAAPASAVPTVSFVGGVLRIVGEQTAQAACASGQVSVNGSVQSGVACGAVIRIEIDSSTLGNGTVDLTGVDDPRGFTGLQSIDIVATPGNDFINLSSIGNHFGPGPDVSKTIHAGGGADTIWVNHGGLALDAGPGNDTVAVGGCPTGVTVLELGTGFDEAGTTGCTDGQPDAAALFPVDGTYAALGLDRPWAVIAESTNNFRFLPNPSQYVDVSPSKDVIVHVHLQFNSPAAVLDDRGLGFTREVTPDWQRITVPGHQPINLYSTFTTPIAYNGRPYDFVDAVFRIFLGRSADEAGLLYWVDSLNGGVSRQTFVAAMLRLPEHAGLAVDHAYEGILHRSSDPSGRTYWSQFLQSGGSLDDLRALLYGSPEYLQFFGGGSTAGFFDALYSSVLHRAPDDAGRAYWTDLLNRGMNRVDVARAILVLPEPIRVAIGDTYLELLGRGAGSAELDFWQSVWEHNGEFVFLASLAGSPEFYDLVAPAIH